MLNNKRKCVIHEINDVILTTTTFLLSGDKLCTCNLFYNSIATYYVGRTSWQRSGSRWTSEAQYSVNGGKKLHEVLSVINIKGHKRTVKLTWHELKITSAIFSQMVNTAILCDPKRIVVKFPHSPILHYAFSSWIEKTMTKTIHCHWENRFV